MHFTISNSDNGSGLGIFVFLAGLVALGSLFVAVNLGFDLVKYNRFVETAQTTKAVLIERIREPSANSQSHTIYYFLRYQFENPQGTENCVVNRDTRTTSSYRECFITIHRVQVGQEAYKTAVIPSSIAVLYQSNNEGTQSEPLDYPTRGRRVGLLGFLSLLSVISGVFTWKSSRAL